jgi:hypothetical protein
MVAALEHKGADGFWQELDENLWRADEFAPEIAVAASARWLAGARLRVFGYAAPDPLEDDDEETHVDPEFLVNEAGAYLMLAGMHRQNDTAAYERRLGVLRAQANQVRPKAATRIAANAVRIRP